MKGLGRGVAKSKQLSKPQNKKSEKNKKTAFRQILLIYNSIMQLKVQIENKD
jgi:hypothetical protein